VVFALPVVHLKIEEIGRMLRTGDLGIPPNPADRYNQQSVVTDPPFIHSCLPAFFPHSLPLSLLSFLPPLPLSLSPSVGYPAYGCREEEERT